MIPTSGWHLVEFRGVQCEGEKIRFIFRLEIGDEIYRIMSIRAPLFLQPLFDILEVNLGEDLIEELKWKKFKRLRVRVENYGESYRIIEYVP